MKRITNNSQPRYNQDPQPRRLVKQWVGTAVQVLVGAAGLALSTMPAEAAFLRLVQDHQLEIDFIFSETATQEQREAFELAGLFWSNFLDDDVTLKFYVDMTDDFLPENVLGGSLPGMQAKNRYTDFKSDYQNDITSDYDQTAYDNMESGYQYQAVVQTPSGHSKKNKTQVDMTRATAKAVGLLENVDGAGYNDWDGYITMNSNFNWSYDFLTGPQADEVDFLSVAIHELGHQLGFTSVVDRIVSDWVFNSTNSSDANYMTTEPSLSGDSAWTSESVTSTTSLSNDSNNDSLLSLSDSCATTDNYSAINNDFTSFAIIEEGTINCVEVRSIDLNPGMTQNAHTLDLFRYSQEHGNTIDLTLDGEDKSFSLEQQNAIATDGTQVYDDLADCQTLSSNSGECTTADFSKGLLIVDQNGNTLGDGYQGSHWKQRLQLGTSNAIGIMDPALGYATTREITGLDLLALDVVGWDLANGLEEKIETRQIIFDREDLVKKFEPEAQQQAANSETMTRADADPFIQTMLEDSEVYHNCWVQPWLEGCQGGGWQTLLAQNLLAQEVIPAEPEKVPEPTATVGLFSLGLLGLISSRKRDRRK